MVKLFTSALVLVAFSATAKADCPQTQCQAFKSATAHNSNAVSAEKSYWMNRWQGTEAEGGYKDVAWEMARSVESGPQGAWNIAAKTSALVGIVIECYGSYLQHEYGPHYQPGSGYHITTEIGPYAEALWAEKNISFEKIDQLCKR